MVLFPTCPSIWPPSMCFMAFWASSGVWYSIYAKPIIILYIISTFCAVTRNRGKIFALSDIMYIISMRVKFIFADSDIISLFHGEQTHVLITLF